MKYLEKFVKYLNESSEDITDLTKEEIDDLLIPMIDMGIQYSISEPITILSGEFSGYKSMNITFRNSFQLDESVSGINKTIVDPKFWDFLDELISLKNRLESSRVSINTNWTYNIKVNFIQKEKVEGDTFKLQKLYNQIKRGMISGKSGFSNSMTRKLDLKNKKITISVSRYWTDRKWNLFSRSFDLSGFIVDIDKKSLGRRYNEYTDKYFDDKSATITITPKSE